MREVTVSVEQPANSLLYHYPSMVQTIEVAAMGVMHLWMGGWGSKTPKPTEILHTLPDKLSKRLHKSKRASDQRLAAAGLSRTTLYHKGPRLSTSTGKGWRKDAWATGNSKELKESQEYPDDFCLALALVGTEGMSSESKAAARTSMHVVPDP